MSIFDKSKSPSLELYVFHGIDDVVLGIFREERLLTYSSVPKRKLGEQLVESFENIMKICGIELNDLTGIYLKNSFSTWNASRLTTLFVKTIVEFSGVECYLREESQDQPDVLLSLKSFFKYRKTFRRVVSPESISPFYKKCPNINI